MGGRCIEDCTETSTVSFEKGCQRNTKCKYEVPKCDQSLPCVRSGGSCIKECPSSDARCDDNKCEGELCTCVTSDCA